MNFCECKEDGWCLRYQREMRGRFREICAGINCDLGTSAVFREQWAREAGTAVHLNLKQPIPLLLKTNQAPGDAVAMTAAIYSLHKAHPNKYLTAVETPWQEVFAYNPDVLPIEHEYKDALPLHMHYPAIHQSNERGIHFMQGWCEFLGMALGIDVPLLTNRPHLYFSDDDPAVEDFWLICSGGKRDLTNKLWGQERYQEVVDTLAEDIKFVQVGATCDEHPYLNGVYVQMVGMTTLRGLFDLCRRARGVVCGVSLLMHVAAALGKPAVIIAGGREPVQWNAYPKQQYLHTVGALSCHSPQGEEGVACWRSRTIPLGDSTVLDEHPCQLPTENGPLCMSFIKPAQVADLVRMYNQQYEI